MSTSLPNLNVTQFEHKGLTCRAVYYVPMGHWCGYVSVPAEHPWHGKGHTEKVHVSKEVLEREIDVDKVGAINLLCAGPANGNQIELVLAVDVHGGLTFADDTAPGGPNTGESWWLGFDCGPAGDSPAIQGGAYAQGECRALAEQIVEAASNQPQSES